MKPLAAVLRFAGLCGALLLLATCTPRNQHALAIQATQQRILEADVAFIDTLPVLRFEAPPVYAMWRAEIAQCSGITRKGAPTFWITQRAVMPNNWLGMYVRQQRRIVFALGAETVSWIVRHEFLHDAVDEPGHPPEFFGDSQQPGLCGHLVRPTRSEAT